jgi:hypothetical protein
LLFQDRGHETVGFGVLLSSLGIDGPTRNQPAGGLDIGDEEISWPGQRVH